MPNPRPFLPCVLQKPHFFTGFAESIMPPNYVNQQNVTKIEQLLTVDRIHQYAKFEAIRSMCSPENVRQAEIWSISLGLNCTKSRKINKTGSKGGQGILACQLSCHSFHAISKKYQPQNLTDALSFRFMWPFKFDGWPLKKKRLVYSHKDFVKSEWKL